MHAAYRSSHVTGVMGTLSPASWLLLVHEIDKASVPRIEAGR
jgi:hypothetical protein